MALHPTYQVRELSTSAVEIWALRALRGEVIIGRSTTYYLPPTTDYSPPTTDYLLLPTYYSLLTAHDMLPTTYYGATHQVIIRSTAKAAGHTWLREHLRSNYTAAWHEVLAS